MKTSTGKGITEAVIATGILSLLSAGVFGAFGALIQYLYIVAKEETEYRTGTLVQYVVMGFFVGMVVNELIKMSFETTYPGIILISGFIFMKILDFLHETPLKKLLNIFQK